MTWAEDTSMLFCQNCEGELYIEEREYCKHCERAGMRNIDDMTYAEIVSELVETYDATDVMNEIKWRSDNGYADYTHAATSMLWDARYDWSFTYLHKRP